MNIILFIDSSRQEEIMVSVSSDGTKIEEKLTAKFTKAQQVLPLIEKILAENKLKLQDLTEIKVHTGPGSFTGLRVGLVVANILGTILNIPVNGQPAGEITSPKYEGSKYDE